MRFFLFPSKKTVFLIKPIKNMIMKETKLFQEIENLFFADIAKMNFDFLTNLSTQNVWFEYVECYFNLENWTQKQIKSNLDHLVNLDLICRKTLPIDGKKAEFYLWNEDLDFEQFRF